MGEINESLKGEWQKHCFNGEWWMLISQKHSLGVWYVSFLPDRMWLVCLSSPYYCWVSCKSFCGYRLQIGFCGCASLFRQAFVSPLQLWYQFSLVYVSVCLKFYLMLPYIKFFGLVSRRSRNTCIPITYPGILIWND